MRIKKKIFGLILSSMGIGMLLVIVLPHWGFILAAILAIIGLVFLFDK